MIPKYPFTPKQQDLQALTLAKWAFTLFNSLKLALKVFQLLANSLKTAMPEASHRTCQHDFS